MNAIKRLKSIGYEITLEGEDTIRCKYLGIGSIDASKALPLFEELRVGKKEAINYLINNDEILMEKCITEELSQIIDDVSTIYIKGTLLFMEAEYPELYDKINAIEDDLNHSFNLALQLKLSIEVIRNKFREWQFLHEKAIKLFLQGTTCPWQKGNVK